MIVYNSMLFLVFVLMLAYRLQVPDMQRRLTQPIPWTYAIIAMGYITFWAALRSGFVDTSAYIGMFEYAQTGIDAAFEALGSSEGKSPGFDFLQVIFKTYFSSDFHWWLALIAVATAVPITITARKYSTNYLYTIFLFLASTQFIWMFNGIRQFLVAAIMFGCSGLLKDRRTVKYILILLLCCTIHKTALIMLPIYFFVTDKPFGKRMLLFVLAVLSCAITIAPLMDTLDTVLQGSAYANNLDQFAEDDGVHPLRVALNVVPVILAYIKRKQIVQLNNSFINICVNMSTISAGLYFVGMFTSGIMVGRLPAFFIMYSFILIPFLLDTVYNKYKTLFYSGFTIVYLIFYCLMAQNFYYISDILGNNA